MSGFLQRLLRRGPSAPKQPDPKPVKPKRESQAFYLDPDEAQTLGNIDYMRTPKAVRKTFLGGKMEVIEEISAKEKRIREERGMALQSDLKSEEKAQPDSAPPETATPATPTVTERRRSGSEMDMFRTMARDIKRKG